ncbi:serine hydrolase [Streptomyces sp. NPDC099088]|uniref:serine hydrolase n=1 Tax=Streptomyces sp. NPDC099088 TaxID=3366101 RepID=UPI003810BAEA
MTYVDREEFRLKVAALDRAREGRLSIALSDITNGQRLVYGESRFDTASIVKVNILAAVLLQVQDSSRHLTDGEARRARAMIESSDNAAASALWRSIGGAAGLDAANERLGLNSTHAGQGDLWGLTQTTVEDQVKLLRAIFNAPSVLSTSSQAYLRNLMENVIPGQDWGVSAAPVDRARTALKNGWLQRTTSGRWDINSIGRITCGKRAYLLAVLSDGNLTKTRGIAAVEEAVRSVFAVNMVH